MTKDSLRQIRAGHPWLFDGSITSAKVSGGAPLSSARPGDLAVVFDRDGSFAAIGLWDPDSPIRVRVLHHGRPVPIDGDFIAGRIRAASERRQAIFETPGEISGRTESSREPSTETHREISRETSRAASSRAASSRAASSRATNGYRVVHGENDLLPGLVMDRYGDTVVLKLYTPAWEPYLPVIVAAATEIPGVERVVLRLARTVARTVDPRTSHMVDGAVLVGGELDGPVIFRENGLRFEADVVRGHKSGFFLDQRDNRHLVRQMSRRLDVLDVFSYSGGFSLSAAAGGASSVLSVDVSPWAIEAADRNFSLNRRIGNVRHCRHDSITGDAREVMEDLRPSGRRFGLVVVDPPSFASNRGQVRGALRGYGELTRLACELVEPGGHLYQASCSARVNRADFHQSVIEAAYHAGYDLDGVIETGHPADHPIGFEHGEYLKGILVRVIRRRRP